MNKWNICLILLEVILFLCVPLSFKPSDTLWIYMMIWTVAMPISFILKRIKGFVKISYLVIICITLINIIRFTSFVNSIDFNDLEISYIVSEIANIEWWLPLIGHIIGDIVESICRKK